jgi:hypothetical protein
MMTRRTRRLNENILKKLKQVMNDSDVSLAYEYLGLLWYLDYLLLKPLLLNRQNGPNVVMRLARYVV